MDLNELVQITTAGAYKRAFLKDLTDAFARFTKPIIAAVVGFAVRTCNCRAPRVPFHRRQNATLEWRNPGLTCGTTAATARRRL
jgi:hypothetical protein